ncbi:hypothetical protein [Xylocopilactobacillus apicola]|uniref:Polysaccharide biosynthesis protein C-terminal domain-containing protein n=1 Tax=Xylocopilactobacillus apicola TaxID=2932184 RepID=A0AAU9DSJ3_9LACO|nr:hypothetical protein [Xylocopilactobacillus apicola]BDR58253.1 hypothetical protein XA3_06940 [Xylocopilactobacillus apicola]
MVYGLLFGVYFIFCQILVSKNKIPSFIQNKNTSGTLLFCSLIVGASVVVASIFHLGYLLPALVTIYMSSIIFDKYMKIFNNLEKGKKI